MFDIPVHPFHPFISRAFPVLQFSAFALINIEPHAQPQPHPYDILFTVFAFFPFCPFAISFPLRCKVLVDIRIIPQPFHQYPVLKSSCISHPAHHPDPSLYGLVSEFHPVPPPHPLQFTHPQPPCQFVPEPHNAHHPSHHLVFHNSLFPNFPVPVVDPPNQPNHRFHPHAHEEAGDLSHSFFEINAIVTDQ